MKLKLHVPIAFLFCLLQINAQPYIQKPDSLLRDTIQVLNTDSMLDRLSADFKVKTQKETVKYTVSKYSTKKHYKKQDSIPEKQAFDSLQIAKKNAEEKSDTAFVLPTNLPPVHIDSILLHGNPFFIDLVYENPPLNFNWNLKTNFRKLYYGKKALGLVDNMYEPIKSLNPNEALMKLRNEARREITIKNADLYAYTFDELPDPNINKNHFIGGKKIDHVRFVDQDEVFYNPNEKLRIRKPIISPWSHNASVLAQFSEYTVSSNWYQGGNNYLAILGILSGQLCYDNKDNIEWDNDAEWHIGFNSVAGDTIRMLSTNDDILRVNSKLGIKAGGNWFYSGSVDFSTQFFNNYKGINSTVLKASLFTPIRLNVGIGFDYKYKKIFSLMLSPVAFKYIYLDNRVIDPNLFGIQTGGNVLSQIGSSLKAVVSYAPSRNIQLDSRFNFYTNYQKVEIDWEIVGNFAINRFFSTRISFNPRYDNTVIMAQGLNPEIQFKQLISVGFSHKFR